MRLCSSALPPYLPPMPYDPPPELAKLTLSQVAELIAQRKLPPVADWTPENTGDSEMRIARDGRWFHQDGEITRPAMVRAFSSLLRLDADGIYYLVTPHEKLTIIVEDAPFIAVEMHCEGKGEKESVALRLNTDDLVVIGPEHPLEMRDHSGAPLPYVMVRDGLWAKISRPVYYEMAELALAQSTETPGFWSGGAFFAFGAAQ
jgi:uncharacterized protein